MILHRVRIVESAADLLRFFRGEFFEYYRPLGFVLHTVDWSIAGAGPAAVPPHQSSPARDGAVLVVLIGRELSPRSLAGPTAALLFALHASNHEAVVWMSARFDLLATVLSLAAIWSLVRQPAVRQRHRPGAVLPRRALEGVRGRVADRGRRLLGFLRRARPWRRCSGSSRGSPRSHSTACCVRSREASPRSAGRAACRNSPRSRSCWAESCGLRSGRSLREWRGCASSRLRFFVALAAIIAAIGRRSPLQADAWDSSLPPSSRSRDSFCSIWCRPRSTCSSGRSFSIRDGELLDGRHDCARSPGPASCGSCGERLVSDPRQWFLATLLFAALLPISALTEGTRYLYLPSAAVSLIAGVLIAEFAAAAAALF